MRLKYLLRACAVLALLLSNPLPVRGVDASPRFIATYFLTNVRCPSCLTIERLTSETIRSAFAEQLKAGTLQWRTINIDGEGNFHYVRDYKLYTKSVILSEVVDGKEIRWKNLPGVWELLSNEKRFRAYLEDEISAFMAGP
ncbi:MAG: hypothetical protein JSV70_04475 [bacterium]|nr:MAG: hypothetical protein JSV70_04475 [bacterium]